VVGASRILITGAAGQLGRSLQEALTGREVIALAHADLDITDREAVIASVADKHPDTVINAAAWTDTVGCEKDPQRADSANGLAPGYIAEACSRVGATLVHISSNEVFDGEKGSAYTESDAPNPINEYGRSKLVGEEAVAANLDRHQIVRTSWLYGPGRVSFPEKILERARADGRLRLVTDEIASPTWTQDLAQAIVRLLTHAEYGVFHLVNEGECSRKTWAEETLRQCGLSVPIEETTQVEFNLPFRKPVLSTLANTRAAALGVTLKRWDEALAEHLRATGAAVEATRA
jgi:dTDP-4-dehydrorhamnose reductase